MSLLRIEVRPVTTAGADNDVEMDDGPVKDGDMDSRQPALPPEKRICVNTQNPFSEFP